MLTTTDHCCGALLFMAVLLLITAVIAVILVHDGYSGSVATSIGRPPGGDQEAMQTPEETHAKEA